MANETVCSMIYVPSGTTWAGPSALAALTAFIAKPTSPPHAQYACRLQRTPTCRRSLPLICCIVESPRRQLLQILPLVRLQILSNFWQTRESTCFSQRYAAQCARRLKQSQTRLIGIFTISIPNSQAVLFPVFSRGTYEAMSSPVSPHTRRSWFGSFPLFRRTVEHRDHKWNA